MPPIGMVTGGVDFTKLSMVLQPASEGIEEVALNYGMFINNIVDFIIVAFAIFMVVKAINSAKKKEEAAPSAPPAPKQRRSAVIRNPGFAHR